MKVMNRDHDDCIVIFQPETKPDFLSLIRTVVCSNVIPYKTKGLIVKCQIELLSQITGPARGEVQGYY